jgi:hypothetical protein
MLTLTDCLGLSELSEDEIDAIAEHEHVPEIIALELGNYLIRLPGGKGTIEAMMRDDIAAARTCGKDVHAGALELVLACFDKRFAARAD